MNAPQSIPSTTWKPSHELLSLFQGPVPETAGPVISVYLPTDALDGKAGLKMRMASLLCEARQLLRQSLSPADCEQLLAPFQHEVHRMDPRKLAQGYGFFRTRQSFHACELTRRPQPVVTVASSFHIKPLLQTVLLEPTFRILEIGKEALNVLDVRGDVRTLVQSFPLVFQDSDSETRAATTTRSKLREARGQSIRHAVRHLAASTLSDGKPLALLGHRLTRKAVRDALRPDWNCAVFYESSGRSNHRKTMEDITTSFDKHTHDASEARLVDKMNAFCEPQLLVGLTQIAEAAVSARVAELFVDPTVRVWGQLDRKTGSFVQTERQADIRDDCLIDDIVEEVLRTRGTVRFARTRALSGSPCVALLRW